MKILEQGMTRYNAAESALKIPHTFNEWCVQCIDVTQILNLFNIQSKNTFQYYFQHSLIIHQDTKRDDRS